MILTLAARAAIDTLFVYRRLMQGDAMGLVIALVLGVISVTFMACCLAKIGEVEGERRVLVWMW